MAVKTFETLNNNTDVTTTRTLLHEAIPLTGTIVSGTYTDYTPTGETNIKNYTHGMFQSVYDYAYLSSSANHIFDITIGYANSSGLSSSANTQNAKKINVYNEMAQTLIGYDVTGAIDLFESDLNTANDDNMMREVFFLNFSRLLTKDQVKKGSFSLTLGTASWAAPYAKGPGYGVTLTDLSASETQGTNSTVLSGEYGLLYNNTLQSASDAGGVLGCVFYQAGIAVVTASVWGVAASATSSYVPDEEGSFNFMGGKMYGVTGSWADLPISSSCDAIRHRIHNLSFNNTTEINSTVYFCRASANKFNYSSNPSYVTGSKIRVKDVSTDTPVSYITTIGLYSANNELLAVAKLSEPLKKDPSNEVTLRVRLDY